MTVGLISPGQMGAAVGACVSSNQVIWAGEGRSAESHQRAGESGIRDCGNLQQLCQQSEVILSVCPPHDAEPVARQVADIGFKGLYVDCNAISPERTCRIAAFFEPDTYVDGGIVGGPPTSEDTGTVLYLSGSQCERITPLFSESFLKVNVISDQIGQASALKMVFAAYTKGTTALLTAILGVAEHEGVREALESQWGETFTQQTHTRTITNSAKAWRFAGEMYEIADTFAGAHQPAGFHKAAADVFEALSAFKNAPAEDISTLLSELAVRSQN